MGKQAAGQWRPVAAAIPVQSSRPLAPVGVKSPPKPEARPTDSVEILPSYSLNVQAPAPPMEHPPSPEPELGTTTSPEEPRKLIANIPEAVLAALRSTCAAKAEVSLLGRIHGKHPGLKALTAWARDNLHPSLSLLSLKTNNLFEVTFAHPEGRIHALTQADLVCDTAAIFFSSWKPHFDSRAGKVEESLDHPVWVQIVDLCQVLREDSFLRLIGEQIGQVISIDNSEAYRAKLFGPRIRLLVRDIQQLPQTVVIPRLDGAGTVEYKLEFSGLPKQCGRCRAHDHLVRNCPKKSFTVSKKEGSIKNRGNELRSEAPKVTEPEEINSGKMDQEADHKQENPDRSDAPHENHNAPITPRTEGQSKPHDQEGVAVGLGDTEEVKRQQIPSPTVTSDISSNAATEYPSGSQTEHNFSMLQPDDINFPKLQPQYTAPRDSPPATKNREHQFVWKSPHIANLTPKPSNGSKGKERESVPLTRQGYRSGRLAEDFWSAVGTPNTPSTNPKLLRVVPFLTKNRNIEQAEYLVDKRGQQFGAIVYVHIAEQLAGIPWTQSRARQHIVNEVSQSLHKLLIFNNNLSNPFQKWSQGQWYAQWGQGSEGANICTLYVSIDTPEHKVKPRKGFQMGWRREPVEVSSLRTVSTTEDIQVVDPDSTLWQKMAGRLPNPPVEQHPPESHNRFASLLEEEESSDG